MTPRYWLVVYTPSDKPNIVCGPFTKVSDTCTFIGDDFNYTATSVHDSLESALADNTKMAFVPTK